MPPLVGAECIVETRRENKNNPLLFGENCKKGRYVAKYTTVLFPRRNQDVFYQLVESILTGIVEFFKEK